MQTDTTAQSVIVAMKSMFARLGIPDTVVSHNGPQYANTEFRNVAKVWEFEHVTSSPGHTQSNGWAERITQTIKHLWQKWPLHCFVGISKHNIGWYRVLTGNGTLVEVQDTYLRTTYRSKTTWNKDKTSKKLTLTDKQDSFQMLT